MKTFACLPDKERQTILEEAAKRRDVSQIVMEKDFWVCWTLQRLSALPEIAPHLTFKGGTSLSKAYGLIERFSEDIDLTISRDAPFVVDGGSPMEEGISGKERERRIASLKENAQKFVHGLILPALEADFSDALTGGQTWKVSLDESDRDNQTILFYYPKVFEYRVRKDIDLLNVKDVFEVQDVFGEWGDHYIRPAVKLEFGARGDAVPHEEKAVSPYVAEQFPDLFSDATALVSTLSAERTFWEKATILHALYHRFSSHGLEIRDRMSRHYYDTAVMIQKGIADQALARPELLDQVVRNKILMFRDAKASYDTAQRGNLKISPEEGMLASLRKDYEAMEDMFMDEIIPFDEILKTLADFDAKVNAV